MHKYGWTPDLPDHRDHVYLAKAPTADLPKKVALRMPPVLNQGDLGSCTANAIANAHLYCQIRASKIMGALGQSPFLPSRLFIYLNERVMEGTVKVDAGAMIRDGFKSIAREGVCPEDMWVYDVAKFTKTPPRKCYKAALDHQAIQYKSIPRDLEQFKSCLASGYPFVLGITICESFETDAVARSGKVPLPSPTERSLGGHAVLCCGYDDRTQRFIVQNSWGPEWGSKGFFFLPYEYLMNDNLSDDFWTVTQVET